MNKERERERERNRQNTFGINSKKKNHRTGRIGSRMMAYKVAFILNLTFDKEFVNFNS